MNQLICVEFFFFVLSRIQISMKKYSLPIIMNVYERHLYLVMNSIQQHQILEILMLMMI